MSKVRVRFAPSPTGPLHIGGLRTALYNYLFAKQNKGKFILRIEDTDQKRFVPGAEAYIVNALQWCGIEPDEGQKYGGEYRPYKQSQRKDLYQRYAQELVAQQKAYYAFDSPENLALLRAESEAKKEVFTYNSQTRKTLYNSLNLTKEQIKQRIESGEPYVVRFKMPEDDALVLDDLVRGKIHIETNTLDDKILLKADGMPTYHLANVVDDYLMKISHVIRGEEWLPSLALHYLLYDAFGWAKPKFAHLPLILRPSGAGKLSKRDGDKFGFPVFPLQYQDPSNHQISIGYKEEGYFPEALINFLAMLGWNPGTEQEIFSLEELIQTFDLQKVSKSGAHFNADKIRWYNQQYLQQKSTQEILPTYQTLLEKQKIQPNIIFDAQVIDLMKERATFVADILQKGQFFYTRPTQANAKENKKAWKEESPALIRSFIEKLEELEPFNAQGIQQTIKNFVAQKEIGFGKIMMPLRLLITGSLQGPDIPKSMEILGKKECIARLHNQTILNN